MFLKRLSPHVSSSTVTSFALKNSSLKGKLFVTLNRVEFVVRSVTLGRVFLFFNAL